MWRPGNTIQYFSGIAKSTLTIKRKEFVPDQVLHGIRGSGPACLFGQLPAQLAPNLFHPWRRFRVYITMHEPFSDLLFGRPINLVHDYLHCNEQ
jgi:hypothetical protein